MQHRVRRQRSRLAPAILALMLGTGFGATMATAATIEGRVLLTTRSEKPGDSAELGGAVVYYIPDGPRKRPAPPSEPFEVVTVRKAFSPRVLAVPVGSTVRFPNRDPILHNVFSLSGANRFDLGLYRKDNGKQTTFGQPGVVRIFCNVHHSMTAYVLVLETPFHTVPDATGRFVLEGVPEGPGTIHVWHERTNAFSREVTVPLRAPFDVKVQMTKPRVPRHTNKFGKPYKIRRGRRYG